MNKHIKKFILLFVLLLLIMQISSNVSAETHNYANATAFLDNITNLQDNTVVIINSSEAKVNTNYTINASNITIKTVNGNVSFKGNVSNAHFIINGSNVTLQGITFKNFKGTQNGGAVYWNGDKGTVSNCNFTNNTAYKGGAIYVDTMVSWNMANCTFRENTATTGGGAIYTDGSVINWVMTDCTFSENTARYGGAICTDGSVINWTMTNCTFENNTAQNIGGAICTDGSVINWTMTNCTFNENQESIFGGGAIFTSDSVINWIMNNCTFENNVAQGSGGAIYTGGNVSNWTMTNCTFENNTAKDSNFGGGGAICTDGSVINWTMTNCTFENNTNNGNDGGAISIYNVINNWTMTDCTFTENQANTHGGAIYTNTFVINWIMNNCTFTKNSAGYGGAIYTCGNVSNWIMNNCTFTKNSAGYGGAIYTNTFVINWIMNNCTFTENSAEYGGAIYTCGNVYIGGNVSNWNMTGCKFTNNTANHGGAIYTDGNVSNWIMTDCTFTENKAQNGNDGGGAIYTKSIVSNWIMTDCTFENNVAQGIGGAIFTDDNVANWIMTDCTFTENKAKSGSGGAISTHFVTNWIMTECTFTKNSAAQTLGGGAIYARASVSNWTMTDCTFENNTAKSGSGGAIYARDSVINWTMTDCTFENNAAHDSRYDYGGAIFTSDSVINWIMNNCTFENNTAQGSGGAIYTEDGVWYWNMDNCTFISNTATYGGAIYVLSVDNWYQSNCWFTNNTATKDGGAIYGGSVGNWIQSNCIYQDNSAEIDAGAILIGRDSVNVTIFKCNFTNNSAKYGHGAILCNSQSSNITDCNFNNNTATYAVGAIGWGGAKGILNNCNFTNNAVTNASTDNIEGGGAIYVAADNCTISNCNFINNKCTNNSHAGAIYWFSNNGTIINCNFTNNGAYYGGAILMRSNNSIIKHCIFTNNTAYNGGAVILYGNITVNNCDFINNSANYTSSGFGGLGAAILIWNSSVIVNNSNFINNTAGIGAAICSYYWSNFCIIRHTNFTCNNALIAGAVLLFGDNSIIEYSIFSNNIANTGSAIGIIGNNCTVSQSNFTNNSATNGTIFINRNSLSYNNNTISYCVFTDNNASCGGAIYNEAYNTTVKNSSFNRCTANYGSAIYTASNETVLEYNKFNNCIATEANNANVYNNNGRRLTVNGGEGAIIYNNGVNASIASTVTVYVLDNETKDVIGEDYAKIYAQATVGNKSNVLVSPTLNFTVENQTIVSELVGTYYTNYYYINGDISDVVPVKANINSLNASKIAYKNGALRVKISTPLNIDLDDIVYGENLNVSVKVNSNATGNVTLFIDDAEFGTVNITNGTVGFIVPNLSGGKHTVKAVYNGDSTYMTAENSTQVYVSRANPFLIISADNISYDEYVTVKISTNSDITGYTTLWLNNQPYNITANTTNYTIKVHLKPTNYSIFAMYDGDDNYNKISNLTSFTVFKATPIINLTVNESIVYGENTTLKINVTGAVGAVTGFVNITIDGETKVQYLNLENGVTYYNITGLNAGKHNITVTYRGNENYTTNSATIFINVDKNNVTLNITIPTIVYGENVTLNINNISSNMNGNLSATINSLQFDIPASIGGFTIPSFLGAGNYTLWVSYNGDNNYNHLINKRFNFTITKATPDINTLISDIVYGENSTLKINITGVNNKPVTGDVNIIVDNKTIQEHLRLVNGLAYYNITGLIAGKHNITVIYNGNNDYTAEFRSTLVNVDCGSVNVNLNCDSIVYGENTTLKINVTGVNGEFVHGNITIVLDGVIIENALKIDGITYYTISTLNATTHNVTVIFNGNNNYTAKSNMILVNVDKNSVNLNLTIQSVDYGEYARLNVTYSENVTGYTLITVNNKRFNVTVANSSNFTIPLLSAGNYTVFVDYQGDFNYYHSSKNITFNVKQITPRLNITTDDIVYGEDTTIRINITGVNNSPVVGYVDVILDGETIKEDLILKNGSAYYTITSLDASLHNITIVFKGNNNYTTHSASAGVNVSKAVAKLNITADDINYGENVTVQINVTGVNNNPINGNVTVILNGEIIKEELVLNNTAITYYSITGLNATTHNITVLFNGNSNYTSHSASVFVNVCKAEVKLNITVTDVSYGENVTLFIVPDVDVTGNFSILLNGDEYNVTADTSIFHVPELLAAGNYNVSVAYSGDCNHNPTNNLANFTVIKVTPKVNITAESVVYGENISLAVNVTGVNKNHVSGNVTVLLNGEIIKEELVLNNTTITYYSISGLSSGNYNITVIFNGNGNYTSQSESVFVNVSKANPTISITTDDIVYGEDVTLKINVTGINNSPISGNVTIIVDGKTVDDSVNLNSTISYSIAGLNATTHNITVIFNGNSNYTSHSASVFVNVCKADVEFNITVKSVDYGENVTLNIIPNCDISGYILITLDDVRYNVTADTTRLSVLLGAGSYTAFVDYQGDYNHNPSYNNVSFTVTPITPGVSISVGSFVYGGSGCVNVTVTGREYSTPTGVVSLIIDGSFYTSSPISRDFVSLTVSGLSGGIHEIIADYVSTNINYTNSINSSFVLVKGAVPVFSVDDIVYGADKLVVSTNSTASGNVTIIVDSMGRTVPVVNGCSVLDISSWKLCAGSHIAVINYTGDKNYAQTITFVNFTIFKAATDLSLMVVNTSDDDVIIFLELFDVNGKPVTGGVDVNVTSDNGYSYNGIVNVVDGAGSFKLFSLNTGCYKIVSVFNGTGDYESSSCVGYFVINDTPEEYFLSAVDVVKYYKNDTQYHVTLTDDHGNLIPDETILVTLTSSRWANPVSYNITTNGSGVATLDINLIAGKYCIVATFLNATPAVNNITVLEVSYKLTASDVVKYYRNGSQYSVSVVDQSGNPVVDSRVTLCLSCSKWAKPVYYSVLTDDNGVAVLPINLVAGKYSIVASIGKFSVRSSVTVFPTLTADSIVKKISQPAFLEARLVDGHGSPSVGKLVSFTVMSRTYQVVTDGSGVAALPINLGLGTWSFLVVSGDAQTRTIVKVIK